MKIQQAKELSLGLFEIDLPKKRWGNSYRKIVVRPSQFNCWDKQDPNYKKLQHPGKDGTSDKKSWARCKEIYAEVYNAPEKDNPIPGVCNYFSGKPDIKHHPWEKNYFDLPDVPNFHFVKLVK